MQEPKITKADAAFSMACGVEVNIRASSEHIWSLLIDAKSFPRWNSTVTRIEGDIREGEKLRVHVPGMDRSFNPKVSDVVAAEHMTWTGGFAPLFQGVRIFTLRRAVTAPPISR